MRTFKLDSLKEALELERGCEVQAGPETLPLHLLVADHKEQISERKSGSSESLSPSQHGFDSELRKLAPTMLRLIGRAYNLGEKGLGDALGVQQSTISRWYQGELVPDLAHFTEIVRHFRKACSKVRAEFPVPTEMFYLCSFAPRYSAQLAEQAQSALEATAISSLYTKPGSTGMILDLYMRGATLGEGVRAHCFIDDPTCPRAVVVLVNNSLSLYEQHVVAFDEVYAHVMHKFANLSKQALHPDPIF